MLLEYSEVYKIKLLRKATEVLILCTQTLSYCHLAVTSSLKYLFHIVWTIPVNKMTMHEKIVPEYFDTGLIVIKCLKDTCAVLIGALLHDLCKDLDIYYYTSTKIRCSDLSLNNSFQVHHVKWYVFHCFFSVGWVYFIIHIWNQHLSEGLFMCGINLSHIKTKLCATLYKLQNIVIMILVNSNWRWHRCYSSILMTTINYYLVCNIIVIDSQVNVPWSTTH